MTCKILVLTELVTYNDGKEYSSFESQKVIDHDKSSDRKWLGAHCFWAMRNSRRVMTQPLLEIPGYTTPNISQLNEDSIRRMA
jgi:hypothetical protein